MTPSPLFRNILPRETFQKIQSSFSSPEFYYLNINGGSSHQSPDSQYTTVEIYKAISELPDDYRIPFEMHTQGYKYKEIAEHLAQPLGSIKSKIFFARRRLMEKLKDFN